MVKHPSANPSALLELRGDLTVADASKVRDYALRALAAGRSLCLDLSEVSYLDAAMLQLLKAIRGFAARSQAAFTLKDVSPNLLDDAQMLGMQDVLVEETTPSKSRGREGEPS